MILCRIKEDEPRNMACIYKLRRRDYRASVNILHATARNAVNGFNFMMTKMRGYCSSATGTYWHATAIAMIVTDTRSCKKD